eukprot:GHVR01066653.1.p1 GENE.GHVR01066653.1~~GHVR01066653.1.p1  ORF type:complete len:341 (-),score=77.97 GHVR01066653.1:227-1249(-)
MSTTTNTVAQTFRIVVEKIQNLTRAVPVIVQLTGFPPTTYTSKKVEPSNNPGPFEFEDEKTTVEFNFTQLPGVNVLDRVCCLPLLVTVIDATTPDDQPIIGTASIPLTTFIHDETTLGVSIFPLKLPPPPVDDDKGNTDEVDEENTPQVTIEVQVSVSESLGSIEDKGDWNIITISSEGVYSLPHTLCNYLNTPDDYDTHPFLWNCSTMDMRLSEGVLQRSVVDTLNEKKKPSQTKTKGKDDLKVDSYSEDIDAQIEQIQKLLEEDLPEEKKRIREAEYTNPRITWPAKTEQYKGRQFLQKFASMLDSSGGCYVYLYPRFKPQQTEAVQKGKERVVDSIR